MAQNKNPRKSGNPAKRAEAQAAWDAKKPAPSPKAQGGAFRQTLSAPGEVITGQEDLSAPLLPVNHSWATPTQEASGSQPTKVPWWGNVALFLAFFGTLLGIILGAWRANGSVPVPVMFLGAASSFLVLGLVAAGLNAFLTRGAPKAKKSGKLIQKIGLAAIAVVLVITTLGAAISGLNDTTTEEDSMSRREAVTSDQANQTNQGNVLNLDELGVDDETLEKSGLDPNKKYKVQVGEIPSDDEKDTSAE